MDMHKSVRPIPASYQGSFSDISSATEQANKKQYAAQTPHRFKIQRWDNIADWIMRMKNYICLWEIHSISDLWLLVGGYKKKLTPSPRYK
jgi:hypothetical protein